MALKESKHASRGRLGVHTKKDEEIVTYPKTKKKKKKRKFNEAPRFNATKEEIEEAKGKEREKRRKERERQNKQYGRPQISQKIRKKRINKPDKDQTRPKKGRTISRAHVPSSRVNLKEKALKIVQEHIKQGQKLGSFHFFNKNEKTICKVLVTESGKIVEELEIDPVSGKIKRIIGSDVPKTEKKLLENAKFLLEHGEYNKAIYYFNKILKLNPNNLDALYNNGKAYFFIGEYDKDLECNNLILTKDPEYIDALNAKGYVLMNIGEYEKALECFNRALDLNPDYIRVLYNKATLLQERGIEEAENIFDNILSRKDEDADLFNYKGWALLLKQEDENAKKWFLKALFLDRNNVIYLRSLGYVYALLEDFNKSMEFYNKALKINPNDPDTLQNKSLTLFFKGENEKAIKCIKKVLNINPYHFYSLILLGQILNQKEEYQKALKTFVNASKINPNALSPLYLKGDTLRFLGEYKKAINVYKNALKINEKSPESLNGIGHCLILLNNLKEGIKYLDRVLSFDSSFHDAWAMKGAVLYDEKKFQEALECFNEVLKIVPDEEFSIYYSARSLRRMGRKAEARIFEKRLDKSDLIVMEKQLENKLEKNLKILKELGYDLKLIKRQYSCKNSEGEKRFIDLLCKDKKGGLVVIELKVIEAGQETLEQISEYIEIINKDYNNPDSLIGLVISNGYNNRFESLMKERKDINQINIDDLGFSMLF